MAAFILDYSLLVGIAAIPFCFVAAFPMFIAAFSILIAAFSIIDCCVPNIYLLHSQ